jgi:dipeptidyl aminopeptidase/acylaminoacyl peptidase
MGRMTRIARFVAIVVTSALAMGQSSPVQAANSRLLTAEELIARTRFGEPALSPDGRWILYTMRIVDLEKNASTSMVMRLQLNDLKTPPLMLGTGSQPQWVGEGGTMAYVAKDGVHFVGKGMVHTVVDFGGETSNLRFSPDGSRVLFTRSVQVGEAPKDRHPDLPKANLRVYDDLMVRHWDRWLDGTRSHVFVANADGTGVRDLMQGQPFDSPLQPFGGREQICFSPSGAFVCYTAKKVADPERSTDSGLYQAPISFEGPHLPLTEGMLGYDQDPAWSPDQKHIAFCSMARAGFEADRVRLFVRDLTTGKNRELLPDLDASVHDLHWTADGQRLFFTVETEGTTQLYTATLDGAHRAVTDGRHALSSLQVSPKGDKVYALRTTMEMPADLVEIDVASGSILPLTRAAKTMFEQFDLPIVEAEWFPASDGKRIHAWVVKPPNFDATKKYPFVLFCQGGPQSMVGQGFSYRWNFHLMAAKGYVVAGVNRRGLPGFGQAWCDAISEDWGGQAMQDLLTVTDAMQARPYIDKARSAAVGASFGWLMGNAGDRFACMVGHCGIFNLESMFLSTEEQWFTNWDLGAPWWKNEGGEAAMRRFSPHRYVKDWKTPLLVIHGEKDYRVPYDQGLQAFTAAQMQGVPSRLVTFPDEGHWVLQPQNSVAWQREFFAWLDRYCGDAARAR